MGFGQEQRKDWQAFKSTVVEGAGCLIYGIVMVVLIGGGLWLVIAVVKWMWEHS